MTTYFVDNKLGGVTSLNFNLMAHPMDEHADQRVVVIDLLESNMARANVKFPVEERIDFRFSNKENYYDTLKRLRNTIPNTPGALILNYDTEMAMLDHYEVVQTTYQLVHDSYNLNLAKKYAHVVDVFICHNTVICKELIDAFPSRKADVFYLPHGVPIPEKARIQDSSNQYIKLLFLGRMTGTKGIFDLPKINTLLHEKGVKFEWLCIGNGPELDALKEVWAPQDKVQFLTPATNNEVVDLCSICDVFVLPTKFEGSPVSLLETMSVGLVPVITKLPGGITDIVGTEIGYAVDMDDNVGFANAIATLYYKPERLNELSAKCRERIVRDFNVKNTAMRYHELFSRYAEFYRKKKIRKLKVGARLDQPFIPSPVTKFIRTILNKNG